MLARIENIWKRYSKWDPSFWSAFRNNRHILLIKKLISVTRNSDTRIDSILSEIFMERRRWLRWFPCLANIVLLFDIWHLEQTLEFQAPGNSVAAAAAAGNSRTKPVRSYEISRCRKLLAFLGGTCNVAFHWISTADNAGSRGAVPPRAVFARNQACFTWK